MSDSFDNKELTIDEILADVRERADREERTEKIQPTKSWSFEDVDRLLGIESDLTGFTDYDAAGEELTYTPTPGNFVQPTYDEPQQESEEDEPMITIDGSPVTEQHIAAESFDDPEIAGRYSNSGVFDSYISEVRAQKRREEQEGYSGSEFEIQHENPFSKVPENRGENRERFFKTLETGSEPIEPVDAGQQFDVYDGSDDEYDDEYDSDEDVREVYGAPDEYDSHDEYDDDEEYGDDEYDETYDVPYTPGEQQYPSDDAKTKIMGNFGMTRENVGVPVYGRDDDENIDGQIKLSGFDEGDEVEQIDESEIEQQLNDKRREKAKGFKLYQFAEEYEPELPVQYDDAEEYVEPGEPDFDDDDEDKSRDKPEYVRFNDRVKIMRLLQDDKKKYMLSCAVLAVIDVALIVLTLISGIEVLTLDVKYAANVLLLSVSVALCISTLISGVKGIFKKAPNCDTAAAVSMIAAMAQATVAFAVPDSKGIAGVFCSAAVFALLLNQLSKYFTASYTVNNFNFCAFENAERLYSIRNFDRQQDALEIGRSLMLADPELRYSCKTRFPSGFVKNSAAFTAADRMCKKIIPIALGAALLMALVGWLSTKQALSALSAFTGAVCMTMPAGAGIAITLPMLLTSKRLCKNGAMITSPEAAASCGRANAIVINSNELYDEDQCNLLGFKDYHKVRIDEAFRYAAAMIFESGGPLVCVFEKVFRSQDTLPPVKSLRYEDKLGLTGSIHGQTVLLGNRNLLINHGIEAPPKDIEMKHLEKGNRVLYMAIDNCVTIMFVVGYVENDELRPYLQSIENDGINILISVTDSNISEDFINEGFDLTNGCVKVMNPSSGRLFTQVSVKEKQSANCAVMHDGTTKSFLRCIAAAVSINDISRIAAFIEIIGAAVGALVFLVVLLVADLQGANAFLVMLFTAVWTVVSTALGIAQYKKSK